MPSFFEAMVASLQSRTLPFSQELVVIPSLRGTNWEGLTTQKKDEFVDAVKQLFLAQDKSTYIRYNPLLPSARPIYRPIQKLPKSVITTLLSGEQDLVSLDETGESTQWQHVFVQNDGVGSVSFVHHTIVETSRKKPRNSRSRSKSRGKGDEEPQQEGKKTKKRCRRRSASPSPARQRSDGKKAQEKKKKVAATRHSYERQNQVAYFPYYMKPEASRFINLDFAQVYSSERSQFDEEHCVTSTLKHLGLDHVKIGSLLETYKNYSNTLPINCLKLFSEGFKVRFKVTKFQNGLKCGTRPQMIPNKDAPPSWPVLEVAAYEDHLFPNKETTYTKFMVCNLVKLGKLVDDGKITAEQLPYVLQFDDRKSSGVKLSRTKLKCIPALQVMRYLMENDHFIRVTKAKEIQASKGDADLTPENVDANQKAYERPTQESDDVRYGENPDGSGTNMNGRRSRTLAVAEETAELSDLDSEDEAAPARRGYCRHSNSEPKSYVYYACDFEAFVNGLRHEACLAGVMRMRTMTRGQDQEAMDACILAAAEKKRLPTEEEQPPVILTGDRTVELDPSQVRIFEGKNVVRDLFHFVRDDVLIQERARNTELGYDVESEEEDDYDILAGGDHRDHPDSESEPEADMRSKKRQKTQSKKKKKKQFRFSKKILFFHNLKYDRALFEHDACLKVLEVVDKAGAVYEMFIMVDGMKLTIRDSTKLVPNTPLASFQKTFQLHSSLHKKDFAEYKFYTEQNASDEFKCSTVDYISGKLFDENEVKNAQKRVKYLQDLDEFLISENMGTRESDGRVYFLPWLFYKHYLAYDVLVLAAGLQALQLDMFAISNNELDILHSMTLPSFSNKFMGWNGAFDDMYQLKLSLRNFQRRAVFGGRTFVNPEFEGKRCSGEFEYLDAISLYPSAIVFICQELGGFPTGAAKLLSPAQLNMDHLSTIASEYTVEIRIKAIRKKQMSGIPFISYKKADGSLDYVNEIPVGVDFLDCVVDKITLEDWVEFHGIDFDIMGGIYWEGPKNQKFGEIMQRLHVERKKCKDAGQTSKANLLKLTSNAAYGKTIQKPQNSQKKMIPVKKDKGKEEGYQLALVNDFATLESFRFVGPQDAPHQVELTLSALDVSFSLAQVGSKILAASKRLMNRLFNLCSDMKAPIYYTDTDSFLLERADVPRVAAAFQVKYGRALLGSELGQFHSDFTFKKDGKAVDPSYVHSTMFWPMGKKLYCHRLQANLPDGTVLHSIQYKAKGCTEQGIVAKARSYNEEDADEGMMALYQDLSEGKDIEVVLNPRCGKPRFEYDKDHRVSTHGKFFTRTIRSRAAQLRVASEKKTAAASSVTVEEVEAALAPRF